MVHSGRVHCVALAVSISYLLFDLCTLGWRQRSKSMMKRSLMVARYQTYQKKGERLQTDTYQSASTTSTCTWATVGLLHFS
ncbi:hypothetical protein QQF64_010406 [Cirrhinus molitorella]|uniref:Secreted protein n=1 Tax=Cirrhinus molitorella TaxID=172907 RepID=A0ABR3M7F6_9TELE